MKVCVEGLQAVWANKRPNFFSNTLSLLKSIGVFENRLKNCTGEVAEFDAKGVYSVTKINTSQFVLEQKNLNERTFLIFCHSGWRLTFSSSLLPNDFRYLTHNITCYYLLGQRLSLPKSHSFAERLILEYKQRPLQTDLHILATCHSHSHTRPCTFSLCQKDCTLLSLAVHPKVTAAIYTADKSPCILA